MNIAIVGAGFSGLAAAHFLLEGGHCVTLFDPHGIGGGASGIASGLLHPYPGEAARRSQDASEAMEETLALLSLAERESQIPIHAKGILRFASKEGSENLRLNAKLYGDVEEREEGAFFIQSGMTVFSKLYLEGLFFSCQKRGARLIQEEVASLDTLASFNAVVLAVGSGITAFKEAQALRLRFIKGQLFECVSSELLPHSQIGKGYVAVTEKAGHYILGATFERAFTDAFPDQERALSELMPKADQFFADPEKLKIISCKAAVRVASVSHYTPLVAQLKPRLFAMTAMGSRGLLYHALAAKKLAKLISF